MEQLIKKRGSLKAQVTRIENYFQGLQLNEAVLEQVTERIEKLNRIFDQYEDVQFEIESQVADIEDGAQEVERSSMELKYFNAKAKEKYFINELSRDNIAGSASTTNDTSSELNTAIQSLMTHQTSLADLISKLPSTVLDNGPLQSSSLVNQPAVPGTDQHHSQIKLQPIEIPLFNGSYKDWPEFYDLYNSLVHNNPRFSPCEKLQYLKKSLTGNASNILKNLTITDANYRQAYEELVNTFNKKDVIIDAYLQRIMEQQKLHSASADSLRILCSNVNESVRALNAMNLPTQHWDRWLIFILASKMDHESVKLWRRECSKRTEIEEIKFSDLITFINNRIYELSPLKDNISDNVKNKNYQPNKMKFTHTSSVATYKCFYCQDNHAIFTCPKFIALPISKRREYVKQKSLCFNCLRSKHLVKDCNSKFSCKYCNIKHNSLLHENKDNKSNNVVISNNQTSSSQSVVSHVTQLQKKIYTTILPTAIVLIQNKFHEYIQCRILLDTGSQINLISESCVQKLQLQRTHARLLLNGIGSKKVDYTKGKVQLNIKSRINNFQLSSEALIINKVTSNLPPAKLSNVSNGIFDKLELADPYYYKPDKIDMIVGCNIFFQILEAEKIYNGPELPMAQQTKFGWIISGKGSIQNSNETVSLHTCINIEERLKSFWEIEDFPVINLPTDEELKAEQHFVKYYSRNDDGRYVVRLPFHTESNTLGVSRDSAVQTLQSMEKRFEKDANLKSEYTNFINEYLYLNHMVEVTQSQNNQHSQNKCFYMPHHAVFKESTTTRLRVVFDASRKTSTGVSLNNLLLVGPTIQKDIWSLLLNFRTYKIAYTADIAKMYRQILVNRKDTPYQRILWRNSVNEEIKEYELLTVTYGTASAPFLAVRTLKQLAEDEQINYKIGAKNLIENFYVDDFVGGSHSIEDAINTKNELMNLLILGKFDLRKWASNSEEFLSTINNDHKEIVSTLTLQDDKTIKALGLKWQPSNDCFIFSINLDQMYIFKTYNIVRNIKNL